MASAKDPAITPVPFDFAKLLQGRVALEFPSSVIKEETVSEAYDKGTARYIVIWYNTDEDGEPVDLSGEVKKLAADVLDAESKKLVSVKVYEATRSKDTSQIMVAYDLKETMKSAATEDSPKQLSSGVEIVVKDARYTVTSPDMGTSWSVYDAEGTEVDIDYGSVAEATAAALKHVLVDLSYVEEASGGKPTEKAQDAIDREFLGGLLQWYANSPVINKEAKKHLVALVELVTKRDFKAVEAVEED